MERSGLKEPGTKNNPIAKKYLYWNFSYVSGNTATSKTQTSSGMDGSGMFWVERSIPIKSHILKKP